MIEVRRLLRSTVSMLMSPPKVATFSSSFFIAFFRSLIEATSPTLVPVSSAFSLAISANTKSWSALPWRFLIASPNLSKASPWAARLASAAFTAVSSELRVVPNLFSVPSIPSTLVASAVSCSVVTYFLAIASSQSAMAFESWSAFTKLFISACKAL